MAIFTFSVESMIRGYHEYIRIWESPSPTDNLFCQREIGNPHNTHVVTVKGNVAGDDGTMTTVDHVPRKLSVICSIFIRRGGTINYVVCKTNSPPAKSKRFFIQRKLLWEMSYLMVK